MIIDCIADLHGFYPELEGGDLLIIAGDLTASDRGGEYWNFIQWLSTQKYRKKIVVCGNHDNMIARKEFKLHIHEDFDYLEDEGIEFEGLKIWGTPWSMTFPGMNPVCKAFTVDDEDFLEPYWTKIPHDVDILITHTPPYAVLDEVIDERMGFQNAYRRHAGSNYLNALFKYVFRPKLHVFGHIHEGYGQGEFFSGYNDTMVKSVNASHVNEKYEPVNPPIRVIF